MKEFPPFRLDPGNQCLWRRIPSGEDERILLTPTEYSVLEYLVERAGQLVTHRELLDAVWPNTAIEPQAVKSRIFHLRRLLDDDPRKPRFIETLSRRGYRFVAKLSPVAPVGVPDRTVVRLVGREAELEELWQCLRATSTARPQIVFITGEAGIGKTALADEFQRQVTAARPAVRIAHGQCVEGFGSKEPFYPVLQAVGQLCGGPAGAAVVATLASHAPTWLVQFPSLLTREHREILTQEILGTTRERMLREICGALAALTASVPLVLILEDLQWADSSTLDLVSAIARHPMTARIMVIGTYRSTEVAHPAQPLFALKRDLVARHLCREIALEPLEQAEIASFLSDRQAITDVPEELAALLQRHTEGNPLFMVAILEHLTASGLVERNAAGWRLTRKATSIFIEVPEGLRQMIGAQVDRLDEPDQQVLEVAAIAGMSFAPAISGPSADLDPDAFEARCDALARRGQIVRLAGTQPLPDGRIVQRYEFVHALYREVLYERQAPARRAMLHRRRAERLEAVFATADDEVATEIAYHFERGSDWPNAVRYLRRAAEVAARRYSLEAARVNLLHALALADRLPASIRATVETGILSSLSGIYLATFDARVVETLTNLREKAAESGLLDVEIQALVDLAYPLAWVSTERSLEVIDRALRLSETQDRPLQRARTLARCMVRRVMARGWDREDVEESRQALAEIRRLGTREDAAWHLIDSGFVELNASQYRQVAADVVDSLAALRTVHDENIPLGYVAARRLGEYIVPWSLTFAGEWGAALREFNTSIALAERNGDGFGSGVLQLVKCWLQLLAMDYAGVRSTCAAMHAAPPGGMFGQHLCLTVAGAAEAGLGNHDDARERLLQARSGMDAHPALLDWYTGLWQRWALTNVWLSTGETVRAREEAALLVANADNTDERTWQALARETQARVAIVEGDLLGAREAIGRALAAIEGYDAPVAAWQVHATAGELASASGGGPAASRHWAASRDIVLRLAASLEHHEELRQTFLSAPPVASVLCAE